MFFNVVNRSFIHNIAGNKVLNQANCHYKSK